MTLWNLLVGIVFFIPVIGALDSSKQAGTAVGGYALAIAAGLVVGAGCAMAMWRLGKVTWTLLSKLESESRQRWYFRALYCSTILWIFFAAILGKSVTFELLKFFR